MTTIPELVKWATSLSNDIRIKKARFEPKDMPKIDAYLHMIIDRGEIIIKDTTRIQRFMDDIQDGLKQLEKRGVKAPENKPENGNDRNSSK